MPGRHPADGERMRSVTGMCVGFGTLVGGYVPALWGASGFSVIAVVFGAVGGIAGLWVGLRVSSS
jgi:hypothetical protein